MATKIDLKKTLATYRASRGRFDIVEVPELRYLMVDGHGDPNTSAAPPRGGPGARPDRVRHQDDQQA
jgi:hypothetical protein